MANTNPLSSRNDHPAPFPTSSSPLATGVEGSRGLKRPASSLQDATRESDARRRSSVKVSRACDRCKSRKQKCDGTYPCGTCSSKKVQCLYNTDYRRGRPPTPPPAEPTEVPQPNEPTTSVDDDPGARTSSFRNTSISLGGPSRASPELESAEIEGQFVDPTSNLAFLHRAWKRFSKGDAGVPGVLTGAEKSQPLTSAGDKPLIAARHQRNLPGREESTALLELYFEKCVVTYRCLHRQYCTAWLNALVHNVENGLPPQQGIGHAKAALAVNILAIAALRQQRIARDVADEEDDDNDFEQSDELFRAASQLTAEETGLPRLESVQARVLHVLYLLQTGRMNQAWYIFGGMVPIVSTLGLHRRVGKHRNGLRSSPKDYIISQCRIRTFWVVFTIDKYLAVVFGRPRLYHDDDIDQDFPDAINDEDMTSEGPSTLEPRMDCHVDSLIFHSKIAQIIDRISHRVYSLKRIPKSERLSAAREFGRSLDTWRDMLPAHLGVIRPNSLVPIFRRQALALRLAHAHAIMHANRPFLLEPIDSSNDMSSSELEESVRDCINAAKNALETVDGFVDDGSLFHAFWWTPYVTFCAIAVVYVWEIQNKARDQFSDSESSLLDLAERCQRNLARATTRTSPSRRYSIILDELRLEARKEIIRPEQLHQFSSTDETQDMVDMPLQFGQMLPDQNEGQSFTDWEATDWLDLDSSAFGPLPNLQDSPMLWAGGFEPPP